MGAALAWGSLSACSLVLGALLGLARPWSARLVGLVLAFGAGALISAVSFELAEEGFVLGGQGWTALGLAVGAIVYFLLDGVVSGIGTSGGGRSEDAAGRGRSRRAAGSNAGTALALGAFLDGIPEQLVLGIGLAGGEGIGVGLLVAIFVSNLPEAIGSATAMRAASTPAGTIRRLWLLVAAICTVATVAGYAIADGVSGNVNAVVDGFAAGALLVMLIDSMIPEARRQGGRVAGLATVLGFAVAFGLSGVT